MSNRISTNSEAAKGHLNYWLNVTADILKELKNVKLMENDEGDEYSELESRDILKLREENFSVNNFQKWLGAVETNAAALFAESNLRDIYEDFINGLLECQGTAEFGEKYDIEVIAGAIGNITMTAVAEIDDWLSATQIRALFRTLYAYDL